MNEGEGITRCDGGEREWPLELIDLIDETGYVPSSNDVSDVDKAVHEAVERLEETAGGMANVNEMLLELKRIGSLTSGFPDEADIRDWDGEYSVTDYDNVFGSVDNAFEFSLATDTGKLKVAISESYT